MLIILLLLIQIIDPYRNQVGVLLKPRGQPSRIISAGLFRLIKLAEIP